MMTFDLENADESAREKGYEALVPLGLSRVSENKQLRLPYSSMMGTTHVGSTARQIHDVLKKTLSEASGCKVTRLVVAVVSDWACSGKKDGELWLDEIGIYFAAAEASMV